MRNKSIVAAHRLMASLLIFFFPFVGALLFKMIECSLRYKEYCFFSEDFIDRML